MCQEFSVLYVALCLAQGYHSRLVVAMDKSIPFDWTGPHAWAEVRIDVVWVHVDPSDQVWNQTYHCRTWWWAKKVGSTVSIFGFEDGKVTDLTEKYACAN